MFIKTNIISVLSREKKLLFSEPLSETGTVSSTAANDDSVVTLHLHRTHHKAPIPEIEKCNFSAMSLEDKMKEMEKANQKALGMRNSYLAFSMSQESDLECIFYIS